MKVKEGYQTPKMEEINLNVSDIISASTQIGVSTEDGPVYDFGDYWKGDIQ